jgi:hypothetical protein
MAMADAALQAGIDLASNAIGKNHRSTFGTFGLMCPELDLATRVTVLGGDIANEAI